MSKAFLDVVECDIAFVGVVWTPGPPFSIKRIALAAKADGLKALESQAPDLARGSSKESAEALRELLALIEGGDGAKLEKALDVSSLKGFQAKALSVLRKNVPRGGTISYGALAKLCGSPGAARAVGGAMGSNPFPLFFPCHRVLGANSTPGGFGPGLPLKLALLEKEGVRLAKGRLASVGDISY